jgi:hypothetical protein
MLIYGGISTWSVEFAVLRNVLVTLIDSYIKLIKHLGSILLCKKKMKASRGLSVHVILIRVIDAFNFDFFSDGDEGSLVFICLQPPRMVFFWWKACAPNCGREN